jgi:alcohol dehydrogenase
MMNNFTFHNPTKLIFGQGQVNKLLKEVPRYGNRVLLVYGGGSVLDCAKLIAAGAKYDGDAWDFCIHQAVPKNALPIGTILTIAATGSEMNGNSVITNWETKEKNGWSSSLVYPKFSILDPMYTMSLPMDQTIYGVVDMMAHVLEHYFHHEPNTPLQDGFCETLLRTVIETAPKLLEDLQSYDHRSTILYCGTMALNGILNMGYNGDWASHNLEHAVSAVYDIPHGGGLAILFPNWMNHVLDGNEARFKKFAVNVFGVDPAGKSDRQIAEEGIAALRSFWNSIGAPSRLADYKIDDSQLDVMAKKTVAFGAFGNYKKLDYDDALAIFSASL